MQRLTLSILFVLALLGVASFWLVPPIPQPQLYHNFADQRSLSGIPNFWNVISNLPFLIVGGWGILYLSSGSALDGLQDSTERWLFLFFFIAVAFTGVGSAYYHLAPNNERLVWDRLPITMAFMALFAIIIAERLGRRVGVLLFVSLIVFGVASVLYWHLTETWGRGDLRPYLLVQFYPVVAIPIILALTPKAYTRTENLYSALAWYVGAKLYEILDDAVFSFGNIVSGHTLKHIGAAVSCYMILSWIRQRRLVKTQACEVAWPVTDPNTHSQ